MLRILMSCLMVSSVVSLTYDFPNLDTPVDVQKKAVEDLIIRLIGLEKSTLFQINIHINDSDDTFLLQKSNDIVYISSTSGVGAAYGFHFYLKYFCHCHVSWDADQLQLPSKLPDVNFRGKSFDRFRYFQNICTYSYSYVWWTWERWEREIDWMALNGVNLALAFTAQEAIWLPIYRMLNMTENEINEHFAGPAFLAWSRIGNIRGWGGPLFERWHQESVALQHMILQRMKNLGITPVLPAFCGHVPRAFKRLFPRVKMTAIKSWANFPPEFCCPYLLDPTEYLFAEVGKLFMQELKAEFGITHFYNCDIFNEMRPPYEDGDYLSNISSTVYNIMSNSDTSAVWILQGWLFANDPDFWSRKKVKYFLSGVANDKMIVLDLQSEVQPLYVSLSSYFGKPFIWCMLHNFGGTLGMHGSLGILNTRIFEARAMENTTMIGTGLTPEGINQNYVVYDFMVESAWRDESVDLDLWIAKYAERRYGSNNVQLKTAWKLLKNSVYNYLLLYPLHGQYTLVLRPSPGHAPWVWYDINDVLGAWDFMSNITDLSLTTNMNYLHDLVDVTRQVLQLRFDQLYRIMMSDYFRADLESFKIHAQLLLDVLTDLDAALSTNIRFMLGPWLRDAKARGNSIPEKQLLEMNARNQITLWGPNGEITDYAAKQWAGLVKDYYYQRWRMFIKYLYISLVRGIPFIQKTFERNLFKEVEEPFSYSQKEYPSVPQNDTVTVIRILYSKWRHIFETPRENVLPTDEDVIGNC